MAPPFPGPTSIYHDNTYESISPTRPELSAKGKTVVVTGGGTGIGAETARSFAAAGASRIALFGRREQPLLDTKASIEQKFRGTEVFVASTDVTAKSQVDSTFAKFAGEGKIDVLISNAAVTGPLEAVKDVDTKKFLEGVHTNLAGNLYVAQAFLRHAAEDAVVVEVNSSAAHINIAPAFASYSVAKLAVFRLWDTIAFASPHIRVYHIQPGVVDTDMNRGVGGVAAIGFEDHGKFTANFNVWLASPEAVFLKGKFLWANWDVDELKAKAKEIEDSTRFDIQLIGWPFQEGKWVPTWNA